MECMDSGSLPRSAVVKPSGQATAVDAASICPSAEVASRVYKVYTRGAGSSPACAVKGAIYIMGTHSFEPGSYTPLGAPPPPPALATHKVAFGCIGPSILVT